MELIRFAAAHPTAATAGFAGGVAALHLLPRALGFGSSGPIAGSFAARMQSAFYGGNAGGVFSVLQRFGMVGVGLAPEIIAGAVGVLIMSFLVK